MAGFTDEEMKASVDQFLLRQLSVSQLTTGARDVRVLRSVVYDLVSTALLLRPDSLFYIVWLASNKLKSLVIRQIAVCDTLAEYGPDTTRPSQNINDVAELTNARAALLEMNSGLNTRGTGVSGSMGPAIDRFRRSISNFLNTEITKNVVVNGLATETAEGLRTKIAEIWAGAIDTHTEIVSRSYGITSALTELAATRLPQSSIQSIAMKAQTRLIELESILKGPQGIQQSKTAMLDLLTMRTLMTKASSFRAPTLKLMPLTGDATKLVFVDSDGGEASIMGTVSAPFNYNIGDTVSVSVNAAAPFAVTLPGGSAAEIRSRVISPWDNSIPAAPRTIHLVVDHGASGGSFTWSIGYAAGATFALAVQTMIPTVSVTWDDGPEQLIFRSLDNTDVSYLQFLVQDPLGQEANWVEWSGVALEAAGVPPPIEEVIVAFSNTTPPMGASKVETLYGNFNGIGLGDDTIWNKTAAGTDLTMVTDSVNASSATKNLSALGVVPGMYLEVVSGQYRIKSVTGGELVLDTPSLGTGTVSFFIGTNYAGADGAVARIVSRKFPSNSGAYRVVAGGVARIVLNRILPTTDDSLQVSVLKQNLKLSALGTTTSSSIEVMAANPLGLAVSSSVAARLMKLDISGSGDFLFRGVQSGDYVYLTSPTWITYQREIASVTNTSIILTASVPYELGDWGYEIQSVRVLRYIALTEGPIPYVGEFFQVPEVLRFDRFDSLIGRLVDGGRYIGPIQDAVESYRSGLVNLLIALEAYSVPTDHAIDNVIRTLREQGLDRALDLFLSLQISEFFSMDPEGVSYSTWLTSNAARAAREITPATKIAKSNGFAQSWARLSFQVNPLELRSGND